MPEKHLNDITTYQWIGATLMAIWATIAAFLARHIDPKDTTFFSYIRILVQDVIISGGIAYMTFMAAMGYGMPDTIAIPLAGFVGHKAARFSYLIELYIKQKLGV